MGNTMEAMTNVTDEYKKQRKAITDSLKTQEKGLTDLKTLCPSKDHTHGDYSQWEKIHTAIDDMKKNLTILSGQFHDFKHFLENLQINVPTKHAEGSGSKNGKMTPGTELNVFPGHTVQSTQHMQEKQGNLSINFNEDKLYALKIAYEKSEQEKTLLQNTLASYTQRISSLQNELALTNKPRQITQRMSVQILQRNHGDLVDKVVDELISMLQGAFSSENIDLGVLKCEKSDDIRRDEPLLIVCINASRLGSDAETAMKLVHGSCMTGLLIFHHKDAQVSIPPSDQSLKGEQFKSMGGIFDFAFFSGKGIYSCPMNDASLNKVNAFIYRLNEKTDPGPNTSGHSFLQKLKSPFKLNYKY